MVSCSGVFCCHRDSLQTFLCNCVWSTANFFWSVCLYILATSCVLIYVYYKSPITDTSEAEVGVYVMLDGKSQQITHQSGTIVSHRGYPRTNYAFCIAGELKFKVNGVLFLNMEFYRFDLQKRNDSGWDDLQITVDTGDRQYCGAELSGRNPSRNLISVNGVIALKFHTDHTQTSKGFRFKFKYFGK